MGKCDRCDTLVLVQRLPHDPAARKSVMDDLKAAQIKRGYEVTRHGTDILYCSDCVSSLVSRANPPAKSK